MQEGPFVPTALVRCALSPAGVVDALRNSVPVNADSTVSLDFTPDSPFWSRIYELEPVPLPDSYGFYGVELVVGRQREAVIDPREPEQVSWIYELSAWKRPSILEKYGAPKPLDKCGGIGELLDFEASEIARFQQTVIREREADLEALLGRWRSWVSSTGIEDAKTLLRSLEDLALTATKLNAFSERSEVRRLGQQLAAVLQAATTVASDDTYAALMDVLAASIREYEILSDQLDTAQQRRAALDEAAVWVRGHGSSRLKKALALGLLSNSMGAYRDERLALERPGWKWSDNKGLKGVVNPDEFQLDQLEAAKKTDEDVELRYSPQKGETILVGSFLGRTIEKSTDYHYEEEPF